MKSPKWFAAVVMLAVGTLGLSLVAAASQQPPTRTTITLFDPNKTEFEKFIDETRKGDNPGDWSVFREKMLDPETCEKAASVIGRLVIVEFVGTEGSRDAHFIVDFGVLLDDGKVTAYTAGKFSEFEQEGGAKLAVTGGTEAYKDVTGEITILEDQRMCDTRGALITADLQV